MIVAAIMRGVGREQGLNIAMMFWVLCGVFMLSMACTLTNDEQCSQRAVADELCVTETRSFVGKRDADSDAVAMTGFSVGRRDGCHGTDDDGVAMNNGDALHEVR